MNLPPEKSTPTSNWLKDFPEALIDRQTEKKFRWLGIVWLLALYATGLFFWGNFLDWGNTSLDFEDWGLINSPRLDFIRDALRSGQLPLHMKYEEFEGQESPLRRLTDRFLTMPDVLATPQTLLLMRFGITVFVFFDLLIQFTLGTLGLLWFRQKYNLSLLAFAILFLLFQFNGYIQSHYAVGHITWAGYFLFPLFIALLIQFTEGEQNWTWVAKVACLLFYMVLAGSEHHFIWILIFLGVFALVCIDKIGWILAAALCAGLLSAFRLFPPVLIVQNVQNWDINKLLPGYPTTLDVLRSMIVLVPPASRNFVATSVSWMRHWEFDIYIGLVGTAFILYFGLLHWLKDGQRFPALQKLFIPTLVIFLLTIGNMFSVVRALPLPFFEGERVPSRIIALPLVVIILVAAVYFQYWLDERRIPRPFVPALGIAMLILLGNDLWMHAQSWNVEAFRAAFGPVKMTLAGNSVINHPDRAYFTVLIVGMLCTLLTGIFLLFKVWQEHRQRVISR
jgi:hypothetical protein